MRTKCCQAASASGRPHRRMPSRCGCGRVPCAGRRVRRGGGRGRCAGAGRRAGPGPRGVAAVVGAGQGELPQRAEVSFGRGEAQLELAPLRPAGARDGPDAQRPEPAEGENPVREAVQHLLDAVRLGLASGAGDSFQVLVRWKVMPRRRSGRGRPPARRGSRQARPLSSNRWITSRAVSSSAGISWAITGTRFPPTDAGSIDARRQRTEPVLPRRTTCRGPCPS